MKELNKHRERIVSALNSLDAADKRAAHHLLRYGKGSRRRLHSAILGRMRRQKTS